MELVICYPERPRDENGFMQKMKQEVKSRKHAYKIIDALVPMDEKLDIYLFGGTGYKYWTEEVKNYK